MRTMPLRRTQESINTTNDSLTATPVLSDQGRKVIDGNIEPEQYIKETRERAERAARSEVEKLDHPLGFTSAIVAAASMGLTVIGTLWSQHQGKSWLVALAMGLTGLGLAVTIQALRLTHSDIRGRRR